MINKSVLKTSTKKRTEFNQFFLIWYLIVLIFILRGFLLSSIIYTFNIKKLLYSSNRCLKIGFEIREAMKLYFKLSYFRFDRFLIFKQIYTFNTSKLLCGSDRCLRFDFRYGPTLKLYNSINKKENTHVDTLLNL